METSLNRMEERKGEAARERESDFVNKSVCTNGVDYTNKIVLLIVRKFVARVMLAVIVKIMANLCENKFLI